MNGGQSTEESEPEWIIKYKLYLNVLFLGRKIKYIG
jgi:hypothetical protein